MKIGYVRALPGDNKDINIQFKALQEAGCEKIYEEIISGDIKAELKMLPDLVASLKEKDLLLVWKLDCLGKSLPELVSRISEIIDKKVSITILHNHIEIIPSHSGLIFTALAEFMQDMIRVKTRVGLTAIRSRGHSVGKPPGLSKQAQIIAQSAETLYVEKKLSVSQIAEQLGICKATLYAYLRYRKVGIGSYTSKKATEPTNISQDKLLPENKVTISLPQEKHVDTSWDPAVD